MRIIVGISGASGAHYAVGLLRNLKKRDVEVGLIISEQGEEIIAYETQFSLDEIHGLADESYENDNLAARISSGSQGFDAFVIVPCSLSTLSKISCGIADNLISRVASICLKEGRKLILVPRETPLSTIQLENMHRLSVNGATIMPAMPGFYHKPKGIEDLVSFIVGKILEQLGLEQDVYDKWEPGRTSGKDGEANTREA
jgi:4-hydroxy-3-polyprenylbenzoate decarboxylase